MSQRYTPFSCGTQGLDWRCRNCFRCTKGYDNAKREWRCDIERAVDEAYMDDGSVDETTAIRMGLLPNNQGRFQWLCTEYFENGEEKPSGAAPFPSMVVSVGASLEAFAREYADLGPLYRAIPVVRVA